MRNSEGAILEVSSVVNEENPSQEDLVYCTLSQNRGKWLTLDNIRDLTGINSTGSIASRIRSLRADGTHIVKRLSESLSQGRTRVFEYAMPVSI